MTQSSTDSLVERLRARAAAEREIQRNNETVAAALAPQLEAFERHDGTHNTFALRLMLDHRSCAKHDAELAADWDAAADALTSAEAKVARMGEALRIAEAVLRNADRFETTDGGKIPTHSPYSAAALARSALQSENFQEELTHHD